MNVKFHHFCRFLVDEVCTTADCTLSGKHYFLFFIFCKCCKSVIILGLLLNEWSRVESLQICWYIKSKGQHGSLFWFLSIKFCDRDFLNHKNKGHTRKVDKPRWNNTKMYYSISARHQNIELCFHLLVNWVEFNRSASYKFSAGGCWATAVEHGHIYYMSTIFEFHLPLKLPF